MSSRLNDFSSFPSISSCTTTLASVMSLSGRLIQDPRRIHLKLGVFVLVSILLLLATRVAEPPSWSHGEADAQNAISQAKLHIINQAASDFANQTIHAPYKHQFWEVGQRSRRLRDWLLLADGLKTKSSERKELLATTEMAAQQLFPFLQRPPGNTATASPLADLRASYEKGSRGIVIPVGGGPDSIRFAGHLIVSLREVLGCQLPIQIAYAGEEDLPHKSRQAMSRLNGGVANLEFLDVLSVFDDSTLQLQKGSWAIKAFAVLASRFEGVILMDADAVFLQPPEALFTQNAYLNKGAYLFHDRLLWQHAFTERHDWWKDQIKVPSPEMNKSLVWMEDYAEECDSGVVVADKSRVEVLVGLLHIAWQNSHNVREEVTYRLGHGDKESWWLGFELAGSTYEFEEHYGSIVGWGNVTQVCSFVIAHVDQEQRLIWYNGSLLKNKRVDPEAYEVAEYWMTDGKWEKGQTKDDMSCMTDAKAMELTPEEKRVLSKSIEVGKSVDASLKKE